MDVGRSGASRAVFLSYASQDAEAAKRIADALRGARVEVWFDQSELVGGDAWDAKIRRQIKECALLIPVISQNTQARTEGYFRLEWRLADQRTHLMAKGRPFLLPVVIDGTSDADAHVPDSFTEVQWTKAPRGEVPPAFVARVQKLVSGTTDDRGQRTEDRTENREPKTVNPAGRRRLAWIIAGVAALIVAGALGQKFLQRDQPSSGATAPAPVAPPSEAQQLIRKAQDLFDQFQADPLEVDKLTLAAQLCEQAEKLEPANSEGWALHSLVLGARLNATSPGSRGEQIRQARALAERAIGLAPGSLTAELAVASSLSLDVATAPEAERRLLALTERMPTDKRLWRALADSQKRLGKVEEPLESYARAAALPGGDAVALFSRALFLQQKGRFAESDEVTEQVLALQPSGRAYLFKAEVGRRRGDMDRAREALGRIPPHARWHREVVCSEVLIWFWSRDPAKMLEAANRMTEDYWSVGGYFNGPRRYLTGWAHELAKRQDAARAEWALALQVVDARLQAQPADLELLAWRAQLLGLLGSREATEQAVEYYRRLHPADNPRNSAELVYLGLISLGRTEEVVDGFESSRESAPGSGEKVLHWAIRARLRLSPEFDRLRGNPRFEALLKEPVPASPSSLSLSPSTLSVADSKSVAVLAFANLSDDKANEYFSDGISEELLNVLAKVPGLKVSARTSAFYFKGKDTPIPEIARQLGVAYVVEGSVRKAGDKVRITAQLIKAADGFHVWSDTFTRDLKDIFAVQDEIAGLIAQNLRLQMNLGPARRAVNPEAHRLALEGRHFWLQRSDEAFARADAAYRKALELEPDYAEAHAGLANVAVVRGWYRANNGLSTREDFALARAAASRALKINPLLAEPHAALGAVNLNEWQFAESEREFGLALQLNPNDAFGHHWRAHLLGTQGRIDEALAALERSLEVDPLSFITLTIQATYLECAGRYVDALAATDRALAIRQEPFIPLLATRAMLLLRLGRRDEALTTARRVAADPKRAPRWWQDGFALRVLQELGRPGEATEHVARLEAVGRAGLYSVPMVQAGVRRNREALALMNRETMGASVFGGLFWSTTWADLREHPDFPAMVARVGLTAEYDRARATLARMQGTLK